MLDMTFSDGGDLLYSDMTADDEDVLLCLENPLSQSYERVLGRKPGLVTRQSR